MIGTVPLEEGSNGGVDDIEDEEEDEFNDESIEE